MNTFFKLLTLGLLIVYMPVSGTGPFQMTLPKREAISFGLGMQVSTRALDQPTEVKLLNALQEDSATDLVQSESWDFWSKSATELGQSEPELRFPLAAQVKSRPKAVRTLAAPGKEPAPLTKLVVKSRVDVPNGNIFALLRDQINEKLRRHRIELGYDDEGMSELLEAEPDE